MISVNRIALNLLQKAQNSVVRKRTANKQRILPTSIRCSHSPCIPSANSTMGCIAPCNSHSHDAANSAENASFIRCSRIFLPEPYQQLPTRRQNIFTIRGYRIAENTSPDFVPAQKLQPLLIFTVS